MSRRAFSRGWVACFLAIFAFGCASGESTSPSGAGGTAVELDTQVLFLDAARLGDSDDLTRLRELADAANSTNPRQPTGTLRDVRTISARLRAQGIVVASMQPQLTLHDGDRGAVAMDGQTPTARAHFEVTPTVRDARLVNVEFAVRLTGSDRVNQWDRLEYPPGTITFERERLLLNSGKMGGAELRMLTGSTTQPAQIIAFAFVMPTVP